MIDNPRFIVRCCKFGMIVQAILINVTPPLFIALRELLGLSYEQIGRLILINFSTQVIFDLLCGFLVDRLGPKPFAVAAQILAAVGLCLFALSPGWFADPYHGLILGTIVFSMGAGILEMLLSPIVNAVPSDRKEADMSLLHAYYAIGWVCVIILSAGALLALGPALWWVIPLGWAILPAVVALGFAVAHIPPLVEPAQRHKLRDLLRDRTYVLCVLAIGLAGATELAMAQWISAFAEKGLGFSKFWGDLVGLLLFAIGLGAGRIWYGIKGEKVSIHKVMMIGCIGAIAMYLIATLSPLAVVSLLACAFAGFAISLLWPGMLSVAAARFPLAGASMFAAMSAAGDAGGAIVPWAVGWIADAIVPARHWIESTLGISLTPDDLGLRAGLLVATLCPVGMLLLLIALKPRAKRSQEGSLELMPPR